MLHMATERRVILLNRPVLTVSDRSPCHGSVTAQTKYWGKFVPLLGKLVEDLDSVFRIYMLECESQDFASLSTWYVGVEHRSQIDRRLQTQFAQTPSAVHFQRRN